MTQYVRHPPDLAVTFFHYPERLLANHDIIYSFSAYTELMLGCEISRDKGLERAEHRPDRGHC